MKSSGSLIAPPGTSSSAIKGGKEAVEVVIDLTEDSDEEETEPSRSGPPSTVSIQGGNGQSPDRSSVGSAQSAFSTPPIVNQLSNNCRSKVNCRANCLYFFSVLFTSSLLLGPKCTKWNGSAYQSCRNRLGFATSPFSHFSCGPCGRVYQYC